MLNAAVRIRSPVPQKRPVAAHFLDPRQIDLREHQCLVLSGLRDHDAEGIAHKRVAPELDPRSPPLPLPPPPPPPALQAPAAAPPPPGYPAVRPLRATFV